MFLTAGDVIRALARFRDCYDPKTASLMLVGSHAQDPHAEPFRAGFIARFDERAELLRRLATLDERARRLLVLWHVEAVPVAHIARRLGISRVHCYRVNRRALDAILDPAPTVAPAASIA